MYLGSFQEVSGLGGSLEVFEIKEGGLNHRSHKFASRSSHGDLTLKFGFMALPTWWLWFDNAGKLTQTERYDGQVIMKMGKESTRKSPNLDMTASWTFYNAFPIKWDAPQLNATSSAMAIESITLSVEYIEMDQ